MPKYVKSTMLTSGHMLRKQHEQYAVLFRKINWKINRKSLHQRQQSSIVYFKTQLDNFMTVQYLQRLITLCLNKLLHCNVIEAMYENESGHKNECMWCVRKIV